ncbi:MAG: insulinase family protein [Cyclobacteriaceae bacterium]|nr:insulinase family protein [Cyclobacteriaceae bacterium]
MIKFETFTLPNGLEVIIHPDRHTNIVVINVIYDVGARDETPDKTGFAHLFEHLMFGGSQHIPDFDEALQRVGGENNAFTSSDITNYYLTVPSNNAETGFWVESDRMLGLSFDPSVLEVQRKVVIEEFKQRYLNKPYGDVWHILRPLAYQTHPYKWPVIGKDISHIEEATMEDVRGFYNTHYVPQRAKLVIAGDIEVDKAFRLSEKWFGEIQKESGYTRNLPVEPAQKERRFSEVTADVPHDALYKTFHMPGRFENKFYPADLLSDILGRGKSSRLYEGLVKDKKMFTNISAYVLSSNDPGLMVISGTVATGVNIEKAEKALDDILYEEKRVKQSELDKVINKSLASHEFSKVEVLDRATTLATGAAAGTPNLINEEADLITSVTKEEIKKAATEIIQKTNECTLYYRRQN